MYVVYNSSNEVVVMCSRLEDANAYLSTNLDGTQYVIKEMPDKEMDEHIIRMAEEMMTLFEKLRADDS